MADKQNPPPPAPAAATVNEDSDDEAEGQTNNMLLDAVSRDEWKAIESTLSPARRNVADMLARLCTQIRINGKEQFDDSSGRFLLDLLSEMETFPEVAYKQHIRPKLESLGIKFPDIEEAATPRGKGKGKKKKEVKLSGKVQIKLDNIIRIMEGESASKTKKVGVAGKAVGWLEGLEPDRILPPDAPWELQLAKEMGACSDLLNSSSKSEGFAGMRNLADAITVFERQYMLRFGKVDSDLQLLIDAREVLKLLKTTVKFTVESCLKKQPHLLTSSQFRTKHAAKFLQPYPTQVDLFQKLQRPGPQLVLLRSPPDTGKTSTATALPELFPEHNIVFCCLARRVNLEVAQTLYTMGIPFAWVHNQLITTSWLCGLRGASTSPSVEAMEYKVANGIQRKADASAAIKTRKRHNAMPIRRPRMFVTDAISCAWLLKQLPNDKTVMFLDEPTMGADQSTGSAQPRKSLTGYMVQSLLHSPIKTVWCSATLPSIPQLPTLVKSFQSTWGVEMECIQELVSMQLNVGVLLVGPDGRIAMPHHLCNNAKDIKDLAGRLRTEPLLLKAYTAQAVVDIQQRLKISEVKKVCKEKGFKVPSLDDYFEDLATLSHGNLRNYALMVLDKLAATGDDELVNMVCSPAESEGKAEGSFPPFDAGQCMLENAHCFAGMTLTVSKDPTKQLETSAALLLEEMPSLKKLEKDIEAEEAAFEKQMDKLRKEVQREVKGQEDRAEEVMAQKMRDMNINQSSSALAIPEHCVVNSKSHMAKYAPDVYQSFDRSFFRSMPTQTELKIVADLGVDEKWQKLVLCGVGAHAPYDTTLNPKGNTTYTTYVSDQMEKGGLAVCAVTKDFTYGANVPCTSVLLDKQFTDKHSANTLRQFIGRVARTGLAPFGVAQFEDFGALEKIFMKNDTTEAHVMEATACAFLDGDDDDDE